MFYNSKLNIFIQIYTKYVLHLFLLTTFTMSETKAKQKQNIPKILSTFKTHKNPHSKKVLQFVCIAIHFCQVT